MTGLSLTRLSATIDWYRDEITFRMRHRSSFASARGSVACSRAGRIQQRKYEREQLRMYIAGLRALMLCADEYT